MRKYLLIFFSLVILTSCNKEVDSPGFQIEYETNNLFDSCIDYLATDQELEVLTWNIEHFPKHDNTVKYLRSIISSSNFDLWGLQEIESTNDLRTITNVDHRYSVLIDEDIYNGVNNNYHLAFVYRNDHLELLEQNILPFDTYYFPRRPLMAKFKNLHDDTEFYVINLHLKCCGGDTNEMRREKAAEKLHEFIDTNHPDDKLIVLGDYNTIIYPYAESNMTALLDEPSKYKFSDQLLAESEDYRSDWSYPSWPSHIDHILITNELFDSHYNSKILELNNCSSLYDPQLSDHRPVLCTFK